MFERYTESARRALFWSRYEASQFGAMSIETEHLLLGVARDPRTIVGRILAAGQVSHDGLRKEIEDQVGTREKVATSVEVPFSAETKRALQYAVEEADRLTHTYIGMEHLLLGLLREDQSVAGKLLARHGFQLADVRAAIVKILEESTPQSSDADSSDSGVSTRINEIVRSIDHLAGMLPKGSDERALAESIAESLMQLKRHLRG